MITALVAAVLAQAHCPPLHGAESLLKPGGNVLFGETHGLEEVPRFVGDFV